MLTRSKHKDPYRSNEESVDVHITMPKSIRDELKIIAIKEDLTMREIIIRAIEMHIRSKDE